MAKTRKTRAKTRSKKRPNQSKSGGLKRFKVTLNRAVIVSTLKGVVWRTAVLIFLFLLGYTVFLDRQIVKQFEGQKWALPAHVYTRPMEVYIGQSLQRARLIAELTEIGYVERPESYATGTYFLQASSLQINQREFQFYDGIQAAQTVSIDFARQGDYITIQRIRVMDELGNQADEQILRLEPRLFGSVSPMSHEDRALIKLGDVPKPFLDALIEVEDRQFFSHFGVNPIGIARAMLANLKAGSIVQGGSTLTQQLVKNYYLSLAQTYTRKFTEMIMAVLLEIHYDKEEILQTYINEVYLSQAGNRAIHGFGLASRHYFGQPLDELGLDQLALLVGINNGPSYYHPIRRPERALKRRNWVLKKMFDADIITELEYEDSVSKSLRLNPSVINAAKLSYPAFMGLVRENLQSDYQQDDLNNDGLKIYTTLNPRIQQSLEAAASQELQRVEDAHGIDEGSLQIAAVVLRTDNGEVAAMIGDRSPKFSGYNRALQARRPVGSLLKPFVFLSALEQPERYSLASRISDRSITVRQVGSADWTPKNYDETEHGDIMLIDALAKSYNLATVNLGMEVGVTQVSQTIRRVGYAESFSELPSVLLGAVPMTVMDVAQLYLTLASDGFKTPIKGVRSVLSADGTPLGRYALDIEQVVAPEVNILINYALQEVVRSGTARNVSRGFRYDYGLAGKTGTTDAYRDSWFAGYSGNYLTVVWIGRDDNQPTGLTGASGAARAWAKIMQALPLTRLEVGANAEIFPQRVRYSLDPLAQDCSLTRQLPILEKSLPLDDLPCAQQLRYDIDPDAKDEDRHFERPKKKSFWQRIFG
ncbi:MAG: penicillin-binding protein 1B [Pseudomonadota bacterium]